VSEDDAPQHPPDTGGSGPGTVVAGRYEVVARLGAGTFGEVIHARDRLLGREVALKRVRLEAFAEPGQLEEVQQRFLREAQVAARLRHPGIVTTHDILSDDSGSYIVMELVEGRTLQSVILEQGPLGLEDSVAVLEQVAAALDHAHGQGIVHRDVKPANVMIEPSGRVRVMDFGIAKLETGADLTSAGLILGTPNYMPPEQARGEPVDARADVFSLGCVLYECLSGQRPFHAETATGVLVKVLTEGPAPLDAARLGLSPDVNDVLRRAMAKEPRQRYASGGELMSALRAAARLPPASGLRPAAVVAAEPEVDGELELLAEDDAERTAVSRRAGGTMVARPGPVPSPSAPALPGRSRLLAAVLVLLAAGGVLYVAHGFRPTPSAEPGADSGALVQREEPGLLGRLLGRQPRLIVTAPASSSLSLSLSTPLTSETAEEGDRFEAVVSQAVVVEGVEAIPAGARAAGHVSRVQPAGAPTGRGELALELDRLTLEDGQTLPIRTEARLYRGRSGEGVDDKIAGALSSIGSAVGGLFGGRKRPSAAHGEEAILAPGRALTFKLAEPVRVSRPGGS
jgi:tRNA A-37 threonylcarbamoyl transferase component Bud32